MVQIPFAPPSASVVRSSASASGSSSCFVLQHRARRLDGVGDLVRDELAWLPEARGCRDVGVDPLLGFLEFEFALDMLAFRFYGSALSLVPGGSRGFLFVDLHERRRRLGEAPVVGLQRSEDAPDRLISVGPLHQRLGDVLSGFDDDRDNDVSEPLPWRFAHHAPDGLHHVDLAVAGVDECDGVELGDVDSFGEQLDVGEDAALALLSRVRERP